MSDTTPQTSPHSAVLELPNEVRLAGKVFAAAGTNVMLREIRRLDTSGSSKVSLSRGGRGKLVFDALADGDGPIANAAVTISGLEGGNIQLTLVQEGDAAAPQRCLDALSGHGQGTAAASGEHARLLQEFESRGLATLRSRMRYFIEHLVGHLLDQSVELKGSSINSTELYESAKGVRRNSNQIVTTFINRLAERFGNLTPESGKGQQAGTEKAHGALNLVDLEEFEDTLAIGRLISAGKEMHGKVLECLTIRLATVIDIPPLELRLPFHVTELCTAFHATLLGQEVAQSSQPVIYEEFKSGFLAGLGELYRELNQLFTEAGVYPGLEEELEQRGSVLQRLAADQRPKVERKPPAPAEPPRPELSEMREAPPPAHHAAGSQMAAGIAATPLREPAPMSPEVLYKSVMDALNFRRAAEEAKLPPEAAAGVVADNNRVLEALSAIQSSQRFLEELQHFDSLREFLSANGGQLEALADTSTLNPDSLNQIDLIDKLFSTIRHQTDVSRGLRPSLTQLRLPLARLALQEPDFFVDEQHPARGVVDKLSQLAASGNFPNRVLEERLSGIINHIVGGYQDDSSVFQSALEQVDRLLSQQTSAHTRNVERVVKTQDGQERLRYARNEVNAAIHSRLNYRDVPKVLIDLVQKGWRDLLVLTWLKEGPSGKGWQEQLHTLELLSEWLTEQLKGDDDGTVQRGLEAGPFIDLLEQQIAADLPANVEIHEVFEDLRAILAGERNIPTRQLQPGEFQAPPNQQMFRQRLRKTRRLRRWVNRVEQLEAGTWLSYKNREGERRRMQLAWVNPDRSRFVFVNDRGQKVTEMSVVELARKLSRGAQPPPPEEQLSLVDQSMYNTLEDVQKLLSFDRNHDQLTRLINRGTFITQASQALRHANRKGAQHAVLHLNIDQFALVNDLYDYVTGDLVLSEFARLLAQMHSGKVSSARLEEDSFGILLINHTPDSAQRVADRIRSDIETSAVDIDGEHVSFTVSIGVAAIHEYSADVDAVIVSAKAAMRRAKEQGGNRVVVFEESPQERVRRREELSAARLDIEKALATERFVLRAQPIVQMAVRNGDDRNLHYELLLGIRDRNGVPGSPDKFIAAAERHGFMTAVDRWVIRESFQWISSLMDAQKVVPNVAINLSGNSVTDDDFMEYLFQQVSEFGVGTNRLCFEITESGTIDNLIKASDFIRAFRNIGCKFSLDDFGTGVSSHNFLRELPVDYVKIDGSFITGLRDNPDDLTMTRSINDLAHFLGQKTIAEWVENDEIVGHLREIGVDYLQGWGIGKPRLLAEITEELSSIEK
ncbi:MAG: DUF1631 family protein [Parahaliea sp.]